MFRKSFKAQAGPEQIAVTSLQLLMCIPHPCPYTVHLWRSLYLLWGQGLPSCVDMTQSHLFSSLPWEADSWSSWGQVHCLQNRSRSLSIPQGLVPESKVCVSFPEQTNLLQWGHLLSTTDQIQSWKSGPETLLIQGGLGYLWDPWILVCVKALELLVSGCCVPSFSCQRSSRRLCTQFPVCNVNWFVQQSKAQIKLWRWLCGSDACYGSMRT